MAVAPIPIALTIAGSDPSGGAGIQADLKTFSALEVYGAAVLVALTAQNTRGVTGVHEVPTDFVAAQIDSIFDDLSVAAVKIGMLATAPLIETVAAGLDRHRAENVVLDPVMVSTAGSRLLAPDAIATLRAILMPRALLITPNLPEAAALLDEPLAETDGQRVAQGERLIALGANAVLIKGGHGHEPDSIDILVDRNGVRRFHAKRVETTNTHGTGCTLSSAIAAGLARGLELDAAVAAAKTYLTEALQAAHHLAVGHGNGPVHHFHALWTDRAG